MRRRRLSSREARTLDAVLALACLVSGVWRELAFPAADLRMLHLPIAVYAGAQVIGAFALLWRRTHPIAVACVQSVLNLISPTQASVVAAYSLGAQARERGWSIAAFAALVSSWILGAQLWKLLDMLSGPAVLALMFALGLYVQARRSLVDALADRAERAERERELLAERAVADERSRIAAELHDVIAHRVSMMVLQAGALAVDLGADAQRGLGEIRQTGRQALTELREMVGLLGDTPADRNEQSSELTETGVEQIVTSARRAGMTVHLRRTGDQRLLPATAARAIQRLLQESLTNAAKHAPGAAVTVSIDQRAEQTTLSVRNRRAEPGTEPDMDSSVDPADEPGGDPVQQATGRGLPGLRERIGLLGGSLHVRTDGGEFELLASVPTTTDRRAAGS